MSDVYTAFYEFSSLIESKVHYGVLIVDAANTESSCLYINRTSILFILFLFKILGNLIGCRSIQMNST